MFKPCEGRPLTGAVQGLKLVSEAVQKATFGSRAAGHGPDPSLTFRGV